MLTRSASTDPNTVEFRLNTVATVPSRVASTSTRAVAQVVSTAKKYRPTLLATAMCVLVACAVSLIWTLTATGLGANIPRPAVVIAANALFFTIVGVCAVIGRDYRDRRQLIAVEMIRAEIQKEYGSLRQDLYDALNGVQVQFALLRSEMVAQLDDLPKRFEDHAEQRVLDYRADVALAQAERTTADGATAEPSAPPQLTVVRETPRSS